ncbi:hypothetical protein CLCR_01003 [Cladophialophora carrionii]|uniref:Uncharacterized protein n=1 Tax=Cladophialophora carrionii TaxID=86049 RepID=A0A1C1D0N8_9EURO|nr:hypothetical protein CLCR_01003 [Cladophialophora carrionii]
MEGIRRSWSQNNLTNPENNHLMLMAFTSTASSNHVHCPFSFEHNIHWLCVFANRLTVHDAMHVRFAQEHKVAGPEWSQNNGSRTPREDPHLISAAHARRPNP